MYPLLLASALLAGFLLAVQASVNQQLNRAVGTPFGASTLQLLVAASALAVLAVATGAIGAVTLLPGVAWWLLLGGLASPLYITAGILLFPRLGALTAVGLFVTGQVFASLGLDLFGLLAVPQRSPGAGMLLGAVAVLAGITTIIRGRVLPGRASVSAVDGPGAASRTLLADPPVRMAARGAWLVLGLVAGAVLPLQGAVNAQLRARIGAPLAVATVSFVVATLAIAVVLVVLVALRRTPAPALAPLRRMPWWGWLGGLCAAAYVTATFLLLPTIGAAVTVALTVTGQQLASALVDQFGWFRMPRRPLTAARGGGLVLLVVGSVLVQVG
ncbi:DMT family transporter [Pseudonocardia sp. GCM10023141]|uniref:DMT family transporter n=1 Tax=Pseudonocardia sp. GCM10023141 TaxID=3252653 RepID=UPI00361BBC4A